MPTAPAAKQLQAALIAGRSGLKVSKTAGYTIQIEPGRCVVQDASGNLDVAVLSSAITKVINSAWAAGTGNGALNSGAIANTDYAVYLIWNSSTGAADARVVAGTSAPTVASGFTHWRRIWSLCVRSAAILDFDAFGNECWWRATQRDLDNYSVSTAGELKSVTVPSGFDCSAIGVLSPGGPAVSAGIGILVTGPAQTDRAPTEGNARFGTFDSTAGGFNASSYEYVSPIEIRRPTSTGQLRFRRVGNYSSSSHQTTFQTLGYLDQGLDFISGTGTSGSITSVTLASLPTAAGAGEGAYRYISDYNVTVFSDGSVWRPLGAQTLFSQTVTQSVTGTTGETTLATYTVPGGLLHANSVLRIYFLYGANSNANTKTVRLKIASTNLLNSNFTTNSTTNPIQRTIAFKNSLSSQETIPSASTSFAANSANVITASANFAADQIISASLQLGVGTDTGNMYQFLIEWVN